MIDSLNSQTSLTADIPVHLYTDSKAVAVGGKNHMIIINIVDCRDL